LLIFNFNEQNEKDQRKKQKTKNKTTYCHHLLHNTTTIEKGDNIDVVTFFATTLPKKMSVVPIAIFLQQSH